jgi:hypothetical protein
MVRRADLTNQIPANATALKETKIQVRIGQIGACAYKGRLLFVQNCALQLAHGYLPSIWCHQWPAKEPLVACTPELCSSVQFLCWLLAAHDCRLTGASFYSIRSYGSTDEYHTNWQPLITIICIN